MKFVGVFMGQLVPVLPRSRLLLPVQVQTKCHHEVLISKPSLGGKGNLELDSVSTIMTFNHYSLQVEKKEYLLKVKPKNTLTFKNMHGVS